MHLRFVNSPCLKEKTDKDSMLKNSKGLTLIELLITIAVIAIVAAISVPVITNVVQSSNDSAREQMNTEVDLFVTQFVRGGAILFYAEDTTALGQTMEANTLYGFLDLDGNATMTSDEIIASLTLNEKFVLVDSNNDPIQAIVPVNLQYPANGSLSTNNINVNLR